MHPHDSEKQNGEPSRTHRRGGSAPAATASPSASLSPGLAARYGVAVAATMAVLALRFVLLPFLGYDAPLLGFTIAVAVAGWYGGLGPALVATSLSLLFGVYFFLPPLNSFAIERSQDVTRALVFLLAGLVIAFLCDRLRSAERRARESHEAERKNAERFRSTFEQAAVGMAHVSLQGEWLRVNQRLCDIVGYTRNELLCRTFQDIAHPEDMDANSENTRRVLAGEIDTYSQEKRYLRKDGSPVWINLTVSLLRDEATGAPIHFISVVEDIDARKRAEDERARTLAENERLLAAQREAAVRQRQFLREMLSLLSEGRLHLCDTADELPAPLAPAMADAAAPIPLGKSNLRTLREQVRAAAKSAGLPNERWEDLLFAVGEASMNAVVHGVVGARGEVCADRERGMVQVWIHDRGVGIAEDALHRATLEKGFSSVGTMGHGFWMMLQTCDRIFLLTGPGGTTVVLEQERQTPEPAWLRDYAPSADLGLAGGALLALDSAA